MFLFLLLIKHNAEKKPPHPALSPKPENKGPCVSDPVRVEAEASALGMPLLRHGSCWPDIAGLAEGAALFPSAPALAASSSLQHSLQVIFDDRSGGGK